MLSVWLLCFVSACYAKSHLLEEFIEQYVAESLLHDFVDTLAESSLKASNENHIGYKNELKEPIFVQFDCDKQRITAETKKTTTSLTAEYMKFKATGSHTQQQTQKYMYNLVRGKTKMSKVPGNGWLQEATPASCRGEKLVYVSITNFLKGKPNNFLQASQLNIGWQVIISGTPRSPTADKNKRACFGIKCGCKYGKGGDHCWHKCGLGRKMKCFSSLKTASRKYIDCRKDQDCRPDWACGDTCTP